MRVPITVEAKDLRNFGHQAYAFDDEHLAIRCDGVNAVLNEIFIRHCLKSIGEVYEIVNEESYFFEEDDGRKVNEIEFQTNLPFEMYENL